MAFVYKAEIIKMEWNMQFWKIFKKKIDSIKKFEKRKQELELMKEGLHENS